MSAPKLALCFFAVNTILTLQLKGRGLFASSNRMVRKILEGLSGCAAVWERVLLKAIIIHVRVHAGVFLDGVHSLVVQFWSRGHHGDRLQTAWSLGPRKGLDDANRC